MDGLAKIELRKKIYLCLFFGVIALFGFIFVHYFYQQQTAVAEERDNLTVTGTVEAKTVMVSFKVPGKIDDLLVEEGSLIEKGQELACLESQELEAKLIQAEGAYEAAQAQARQTGEGVHLTAEQVDAVVEQARAKVAQAEVGLGNARQLYERMEILHRDGVISDKEFDDVNSAYELAQSQLKEAEAGLNQAISARLQVPVAQAQHEAALGQSEQARGAVEEARTYLKNTRLKAPISGYITQKFLEAGEMVNAGTPVFEITDLVNTYVKVFIDETKIGRVHLGQEVEIRFDSFPDQTFSGEVVWINDAGEFAVRKAISDLHQHDIRSFEVKIEVPNPDLHLKTGMTAKVRILEEAE